MGRWVEGLSIRWEREAKSINIWDLQIPARYLRFTFNIPVDRGDPHHGRRRRPKKIMERVPNRAKSVLRASRRVPKVFRRVESAVQCTAPFTLANFDTDYPIQCGMT